ncbi:MAG: UDP-N-acetylmuramoyl-L-alanine--D-glutamate ligase [Chloroflexota bacterium]|nr:UDP-N-acetylmuramoyl-L-alanine--D-glutamate ligase [Dehalococcoidia bacterium]MDW8253175.1 UDP-N-acetylmuramoyl-L-alanine--D-glutamate ligase [Chloroflexota bacterium]
MTDPYAGATVTIVGLGREGAALTRYLASLGARVTVSDLRRPAALGAALRQVGDLPVRLVLGANRVEDALTADALFLSPGVPLTTPMVAAARAAGIPLRSEPLLVVERCPAPIIGVTGSSGKTTTTTLIGEILRRGPKRVWVGGNIGLPLISALPDIAPEDVVVMELSSFQLAIFDRSPAVAVVTVLSPDHLDRHASLEEYYEAKRNIVRYQRAGDVAILNRDDPNVVRFAEGLASEVHWFSLEQPVERGAFLADGALWLADGTTRKIVAAGELRLPGRHNISNALAAAAAARAAGAPDDAIREALRAFSGVPHRLEPVAERGGVLFVNDSIATSPARAVAALRTFDRPIIWLAGGRSKNLPFDELVAVAAQRVKRAIVFGEIGPALSAQLAAAGLAAVDERATLEEAMERAVAVAQAGDVVLLSPACASFDQFRDYEARGDAFRQLVWRLARER